MNLAKGSTAVQEFITLEPVALASFCESVNIHAAQLSHKKTFNANSHTPSCFACYSLCPQCISQRWSSRSANRWPATESTSIQTLMEHYGELIAIILSNSESKYWNGRYELWELNLSSVSWRNKICSDSKCWIFLRNAEVTVYSKYSEHFNVWLVSVGVCMQ